MGVLKNIHLIPMQHVNSYQEEIWMNITQGIALMPHEDRLASLSRFILSNGDAAGIIVPKLQEATEMVRINSSPSLWLPRMISAKIDNILVAGKS